MCWCLLVAVALVQVAVEQWHLLQLLRMVVAVVEMVGELNFGFQQQNWEQQKL